VLAPFLGFLWSFARVFIKAPAGRQRFNVLGALNTLTREVLTISNDSYINAESVCQLLTKLAERGVGIPITLILDNARYQRCHLVQQYATALGIELLYPPPYSPNLNLIERLWKFVKKKSLCSKYYEKFPAFKAAITECPEKIGTEYSHELKTLLTLNFQDFKKVQLMTR
jgi:Transposase and inactivated derivatives